MNKKLLIIDDDEEMCMELKEIFTDEGYDVSMSFNGRAGKESMERERYDVVILDLKLPELDGYDVLKTAKRAPDAPKIIILSGRPSGETALHEHRKIEDEQEKILQLADAVMSKPVHIPLLLDKVKQYALSEK